MIARWEVVQAVGDLRSLAGEILRQVQPAIEGEDRNLGVGLVKNRGQHGTKTLNPAELTPRSPPRLDGYHKRKRLSFSRFIQLQLLPNSIVLNNEVPGMQSVNRMSTNVPHQGGHNYNIGLTAEGWFLGKRSLNHHE